MIDLQFEYSTDSEVRRVQKTIEDLVWLKENNYRYSLPSVKGGIEKATEQDLRLAIAAEYRVEDFDVAKEMTTLDWNKKVNKIEKIRDKIIGSFYPSTICVIFTKYGTSGSYWIPNKIIINLKANAVEFLIKTLIHESIHLMIEKLIQKNKVSHWYKERIVDLVMDLEFDSVFKMQNVPEGITAVDHIFHEHYPNMILITKKAGRLMNPF